MDAALQVLAKFFTLLLVFIAPIQSVMLATGALVFADMVTGIWAAVKEKKQLTSFKLRRTITKTLAYLAALVVGFIIEKYMLSESVPIVKTISGLVALTEGKSIFENLYRITGINFWQMILDKLQGTSIKLPTDEK